MLKPLKPQYAHQTASNDTASNRHLAASLHPAEDLRNPQEARGVFRPRSGRIGFRGEQPLSHAGAWWGMKRMIR